MDENLGDRVLEVIERFESSAFGNLNVRKFERSSIEDLKIEIF